MRVNRTVMHAARPGDRQQGAVGNQNHHLERRRGGSSGYECRPRWAAPPLTLADDGTYRDRMRRVARLGMLLLTVVLACTGLAPTAVASFPSTGTVTRYKLPDDALLGGFGIAPDGTLWFPQLDAIRRIDPRSGSESAIPVF